MSEVQLVQIAGWGCWLPIETAPRPEGRGNGPDILVCEGAMIVVGHFARFSEGGPAEWYPSHIGGYEWECDVERPTHWMPLPEPPK